MIMEVTNDSGITFNVVFHDTALGGRVVTFYDSRFRKAPAWKEYGQQVTSYCLETIASREYGLGLILDGGVPDWRIDGESLRPVIDLAYKLFSQTRKQEKEQQSCS